MSRAERRIIGPTPWTPEFRSRAVCGGLNDGRFHPQRGTSSLDDLRQMCRSCLNQPDCKEYAVRHEISGFWGDTTPQQRVEIRRQRGIKAAQPDGIVKEMLLAIHRPGPNFGPSQRDIDRASKPHQTRLDDLVHPADQDWERINGTGRNGNGPPV